MGNSCGKNMSCVSDDAELVQHIDREREEGQALLRSMVVSSDQVNWEAVIEKAGELHAKEQVWLQRQSRSDRRKFRRSQKKLLKRRKRYDSVGSFSVNMLTYRLANDEESDEPQSPPPHRRVRSGSGSATTVASIFSRDDPSSNDESFQRFEMERIDEQTEGSQI